MNIELVEKRYSPEVEIAAERFAEILIKQIEENDGITDELKKIKLDLLFNSDIILTDRIKKNNYGKRTNLL